MAETQENKPTNVETKAPKAPETTSETATPEATTNTLLSGIESLKTTISQKLNSWQFKLGLVGAVLVSVLLFLFYWQHIIAVIGMKSWSARAGATSIECMVRDTNDDKYISCSAMLAGQIVPLECSSSLFNIGCRVNYGTAAPAPRTQKYPNNS